MAAGLAVGIGFMVLFAVFAPSMPLDRNPNAGFVLFAGCSQQPAAPSQAGQIPLKERTWISVAKLSITPKIGKEKCVIVSQELLARIPALSEALRGADGCAGGNEICQQQASYGSYIMLTSITDPDQEITSVPDGRDYELSVTKDEAEAIAGELGISRLDAGRSAAIFLPYNDSLYILYLHSANVQDVGAQIESRFAEPVRSNVPVLIEKGRSLNYTLAIKTLATYGGPAEITLNATSSARDSGIEARFEPSKLVIPERSEATAKLVIKASPDAKDGIYRTRIGGSINGSFPLQGLPCDKGSCPSVKIGSSSEWTIENHGSDGIMGFGGSDPPQWLKATVETDKESYSAGENVGISAFLANEGTQAISLDNNTRLILTVYDDNDKNNDNVYSIDAYAFGMKQPIVIEPGSKVLLARTFQWDQKTFRSGMAPHDVEPGKYSIGMSLAGYNASVFYAETRFRIEENASDAHDAENNNNTNLSTAYNGTTILIPQGVNGAEGNRPFYVPEQAYVKAGEEIRWKNEDGALHTATSSTPGSEDRGKLFDTGIIPPNRFSQPFMIKDPGEYNYFCQLHPWMSGKIIVVVVVMPQPAA